MTAVLCLITRSSRRQNGTPPFFSCICSLLWLYHPQILFFYLFYIKKAEFYFANEATQRSQLSQFLDTQETLLYSFSSYYCIAFLPLLHFNPPPLHHTLFCSYTHTHIYVHTCTHTDRGREREKHSSYPHPSSSSPLLSSPLLLCWSEGLLNSFLGTVKNGRLLKSWLLKRQTRSGAPQ